MSKTVSFAPPRASSSQSAAKATAPASASPRKSSGRAASGSSSSLSLSLSFEDEIVPTPPVKPAKAAPSKTPSTKAVSAKAPADSASPKKSNVKKPVVKVDPSKPPVELKGKRVRVPKDLAEQYGGKTTEERPNLPLPLEAETPKKRLTREQREARKQLMKPDEELLARLARVAQIPVVKAKSEPRGKGWKFVCGRCGTTSFFQVPAGLCDCGAIALKD